jgi:hypothetical protein
MDMAFDFKIIFPRRCGFESRLRLFILISQETYPASLRNIGGSTQVPVHTRGLPQPVKLENCHNYMILGIVILF